MYQDVHGEPRRGTENTEMIEAIRNDLKRLTLDKKSSEKAHQAMLSKALKKADTAVELDNAQDLQGARSAYQEAWNMLQQVVIRMKGDEEKTRLEAIVSLQQGSTVQLTYTLLTQFHGIRARLMLYVSKSCLIFSSGRRKVARRRRRGREPPR